MLSYTRIKQAPLITWLDLEFNEPFKESIKADIEKEPELTSQLVKLKNELELERVTIY